MSSKSPQDENMPDNAPEETIVEAKKEDFLDQTLRPASWGEYIGQEAVKNNLHIFLHENVEGTMVSYSNMLIEEKLDQKKSENNDTSQAKTNKDI